MVLTAAPVIGRSAEVARVSIPPARIDPVTVER